MLLRKSRSFETFNLVGLGFVRHEWRARLKNEIAEPYSR